MGIAVRDYMRESPNKVAKLKTTPIKRAENKTPAGVFASASGGGACSNIDKYQSLPLDATLTSH